MKIVFAGGGTAGHINPAIAIAKYLKLQKPDSEILFVGTEKGMESILVTKEGFDIEFIEVYGLKRKFSLSNIKTFFTLGRSFRQAGEILDNFKPDIVVGTGGYVSAPVVLSAVFKKIPSLIHEQNAFPGLSNKVLKFFVDCTAISFEESEKYFKGSKKVVLTGNPVREDFFAENYNSARRKLNINEEDIFILAFGGSLGAEKFNKAFIDFMIKSDGVFRCTLATGERFYNKSVEYLKLNGGNTKSRFINIERYIDDMPQFMNAADLVICRAGAITIAELLAAGKASILVPSPNVTNNHQEYNARAAERGGAAKVILEDNLSADTIYQTVKQMTDNKSLLKNMNVCAKKMGMPDATKKIVQNIMDILHKNSL